MEHLNLLVYRLEGMKGLPYAFINFIGKFQEVSHFAIVEAQDLLLLNDSPKTNPEGLTRNLCVNMPMVHLMVHKALQPSGLGCALLGVRLQDRIPFMCLVPDAVRLDLISRQVIWDPRGKIRGMSGFSSCMSP